MPSDVASVSSGLRHRLPLHHVQVSKVLVAYGQAVLARPPLPEGQLYDLKYKGIWICLCMLSRAMSGNYVNFGVFDLYGDRWGICRLVT